MDYLLINTDLRPINKTLYSIFKYINKYKPLKQMTVLEVGIGNGNKSIPISQYFKSYFGIEPLKYIYDVFIDMCKKNNSIIKSYNMNLEKFSTTTNKKFDLIILINVIHFVGIDNLIKQSQKILKKNAFIIIQNPHVQPIGWGNKQFVKDSDEYDENKWLKFKNQLEICYDSLKNSKYLHKFESDDKYNFYLLQINK